MGFLPKRITLQNLNQVSVYIEDTNNEYFNIQAVPETLTQGRHAFKIFGSDLLREGIELKMELLDSAGNTVYLTPVDFVGEEVVVLLKDNPLFKVFSNMLMHFKCFYLDFNIFRNILNVFLNVF